MIFTIHSHLSKIHSRIDNIVSKLIKYKHSTLPKYQRYILTITTSNGVR